MQACADWLAASEVPKRFVNTTRGHGLLGRNSDFCRTFRNQQESTLDAKHYYQEDCSAELGRAVAGWYETLG